MNPRNRDTFGGRQSTSANARAAALEKFRARPAPDSPEMIERRAALKAIADAREARAAERAEIRAAEAAKLAAEAKAKAAEEARLKAEEARKAAALLAEQKAARDARYAARKNRKR